MSKVLPAESTHARKRWRLIELIRWGESYFAGKEIEHPRRQIEWLLMDLLSISRVDLYLKFDELVDAEHLRTLRSWVQRRLDGEPLQYITEKAEFYGLPFRVNRHTLIPRPETERLVGIALDFAMENRAAAILDVGTGSGCIAVALAKKLENSRIVAIDKNAQALEVAAMNAEQNGVVDRIEFLTLNVMEESLPGTFDLLVSNPPYVRKDEVLSLMPEVRDFEPMDALTDGGDGLQFYRRFTQIARRNVSPGGYLVLEVGLGSHPEIVRSLFSKAGFENITLYKDLNGDDRVIGVKVNG